MHWQTLKTAEGDLNKLNENPRRSLSGLFKAIRRLKKIDAIGDYPVFRYIVYNTGRKWTRRQMVYGLKCTDFYKWGVPREFSRFVRK